MLSVGDKAPAFTLPDQDGNPVSLEDFTGSRVVVYFYPKDNTPGCTRQACAFRDSYQVYREKNIVVIGISKDSVKSHRGFADKQSLPFILLSDPEHKVIEAFGAWQEKKQYGKTYMGTVRCTFVLDGTGTVTHVFPKAKPDTNASEILAALE